MQASPITLVLMPGLDGTGELFADFAATLPDSFSTITLRYPHNSSSYSELLLIVSAVVPRDKPFVLVAESFSAPLAIQFAATHPSGLVAVILCAGFASSPLSGWKRTAASLLAPLVFRLPLPKSVARRILVGRNTSDALLSHILISIKSVPPHTLVARLRQVLACDARQDLTRIAVPVAYFQATHDKLVSPASLKEIRSIKPDVVSQTIEGSHLLLQSVPVQAAAAVAIFIRAALDTL